MPFYEIIYETGAHSMAEYASDDEAMEALSAHMQRATRGEQGGPSGHSAERIVKVLSYGSHPGEYNASQLFPVEEAKDVINQCIYDAALGDHVSLPEVAARVRDLSNPLVNSKPHESNYKQKEDSELKLVWS